MTLRTRLAVALALLAALSVAAVAGISYVATDQRLHDEVDASLVSAALQLPPQADDDFCHDLGLNRPLPGLFPGLAMVVQCLDSSGRVTQARGPLGVPIDRPGVDVTARTVRPLAAPGDDGHPSGGGGRELAGPWTQTFGGQAYRVVAIPRLGGGEVRVARSLAETDRVLGSLRNRSILVGLVIIALAAVAGALIARRTTRPVTRLSGAAEEIAATGRMDIAVPTGGRDEIGRLARAFSSMLAALTRSRDQQQRLVQDAGHELRTPLTSLRTNIDTLRRYPDLAGEPRERILGDLSSELRELSALVDELVALAVDRYDDEPEQTVALDQLAERAADRTRRRSGRGVLVDAEPAAVAARPQALLRAVGNLLDNAVKFSPDATPVEVTVRPGSLQVRDHGPGIAAEDLPYVFDRFYRALGARSLPGSGLGLAIVRQVAEGAGGTVQVANHPDGGAVFTLRLPPAPAAPDPTSAS
ncbi:MAG TPA: ATP-binding protein [Actinomycetes bacterium]|jgi:two-component system sensor histidine kinase MprB|nr:ATP-binding protein [Actinomycetes bacterium]